MDAMYLSIKEVKPVPDYKLHLTFENGEKLQFDMRPNLNIGIFTELRDLSLFNTVHISFDTKEWNNEADLDTEVLYAGSQVL